MVAPNVPKSQTFYLLSTPPPSCSFQVREIPCITVVMVSIGCLPVVSGMAVFPINKIQQLQGREVFVWVIPVSSPFLFLF